MSFYTIFSKTWFYICVVYRKVLANWAEFRAQICTIDINCEFVHSVWNWAQLGSAFESYWENNFQKVILQKCVKYGISVEDIALVGGKKLFLGEFFTWGVYLVSCLEYGSILPDRSLRGDGHIKCFVSFYRKLWKCLLRCMLVGPAAVGVRYRKNYRRR